MRRRNYAVCISKQVEKEYEFPIIVAKVDGVIQELYHEVIDGTTVSFCTTKDSDGNACLHTWYVNAFAEGNFRKKKAFKEMRTG